MQCTTNITNNPLLGQWNTPHNTPPFQEIKPEHFMPAVVTLIDRARKGIDRIATNSAKPTFENTIEALEFNDLDLSRVLGVFYNLNSAETNTMLQEIAVEMAPMLTAYGNYVSLNVVLFERVKTLYIKRAELNLDPEQDRLLEKTYKGFVRQGANLTQIQKEKYCDITTELSELGVKFDQNELAATNAFELVITDSADLSGLPASIIEAAREDAQAKNIDRGYLFTLHYPSYVPFLKYSDNRDLRQRMWMAKSTLCSTGDKNDNQQIVKRTAELRLELANLLGYATYADYALEERMAQTPAKVYSFMQELVDKSKKYAENDLNEIRNFATELGFKETLMPWDLAYYDEKFVTERYNINDEMTRPYFQLDKAEQALFMLAERLYGIKFVENSEIPIYHPDVRAYDVVDQNGDFLAVLYCDYFPRAGKNSGAWMNTFREGYIYNDQEVRPVITLVNNFTKPTSGTPSLLTFDEFTTMLHEFGHGLHGIFAKGRYSSLTGTNVYRDFVELPSQIMENWAYQKEYLDLWAVHYQTGEKMPDELIHRIIESKNHMAAYANLRQLSFGFNDMAWHTISAPVTEELIDFERAAAASTQILPQVEGTMMSTAFGHIFAGGYAAGYYSYKWAEVLEADAFSKFEAAGIFNPDVARSFRENILSKGGTRHPMELYINFAGAEPTVEPLLRKMGLEEKLNK